ncbi:hypothetical protein FA95DRAFT_446336 [Auriscalpium vulgare]|uniref:Uncharacterized protein n=1 Tax=Auriscalpium vulgare TaxID=40419 RepID=A0ACB8RFS2_9AGAM|nr:hypothetical protein FA95DRAFT_446336 [Auriscalpium vulgare]
MHVEIQAAGIQESGCGTPSVGADHVLINATRCAVCVYLFRRQCTACACSSSPSLKHTRTKHRSQPNPQQKMIFFAHSILHVFSAVSAVFFAVAVVHPVDLALVRGGLDALLAMVFERKVLLSNPIPYSPEPDPRPPILQVGERALAVRLASTDLAVFMPANSHRPSASTPIKTAVVAAPEPWESQVPVVWREESTALVLYAGNTELAVIPLGVCDWPAATRPTSPAATPVGIIPPSLLRAEACAAFLRDGATPPPPPSTQVHAMCTYPAVPSTLALVSPAGTLRVSSHSAPQTSTSAVSYSTSVALVECNSPATWVADALGPRATAVQITHRLDFIASSFKYFATFVWKATVAAVFLLMAIRFTQMDFTFDREVMDQMGLKIIMCRVINNNYPNRLVLDKMMWTTVEDIAKANPALAPCEVCIFPSDNLTPVPTSPAGRTMKGEKKARQKANKAAAAEPNLEDLARHRRAPATLSYPRLQHAYNKAVSSNVSDDDSCNWMIVSRKKRTRSTLIVHPAEPPKGLSSSTLI